MVGAIRLPRAISERVAFAVSHGGNYGHRTIDMHFCARRHVDPNGATGYGHPAVEAHLTTRQDPRRYGIGGQNPRRAESS